MKIALTLCFGCIFFGFFKVTVSDYQHASEYDLATAERTLEENSTDDKSGAQATALANSPVRQRLIPTQLPVDVVVCYACTGCPAVTSSTLSKLCPYTLDPTKQGRCVTYSEQYRHMKTPWTIRGCASERGSCEDIRRAHAAHSDIVSLLYCYECEGDKCNSSAASHSIADFTLAFFVIMASPLIAKYTMS
ncbi:unnamed protein product [Danaus chrysippus]|uniref:(African queen) hypothetical protein n=1 Tax=Danaus chrysippus TaxID=151541 RepID=A0A8J2QT77_9NEOP|nr:unnamed protein product [Danaus chrysippus]